MSNKQKINCFISGDNEDNFTMLETSEEKIFELTPLPFTVKDLCCGYQSLCYVTNATLDEKFQQENKSQTALGDGSLLIHGLHSTAKKNTRRSERYNLGKVSQIGSGNSHFIIRTADNRIYGYGSCLEGQLGIGESKAKLTSYSFQPIEITFFKEQGLDVKKIYCSSSQSYFLCTNNQLYYCGQSYHDKKTSYNYNPILLEENVLKCWAGCAAARIFFTKTNDQKLHARAMGSYCHFQLGTGEKKNVYVSVTCPNINKNDVVDISMGSSFSNMILRQNSTNKVYGVGTRNSGIDLPSGKFTENWTEISQLNKQRIVQIKSGYNHTLARSKNVGEFWVWGWGMIGELMEEYIDFTKPKKIILDKFKPLMNVKINCGTKTNFVYSKKSKNYDLLHDLLRIFENNELTDLAVVEGINVHKIFVENRLKCKSEKIKKILGQYNKNILKEFFQSIYTGKLFLKDLQLMNQILQQFNIKDFSVLSNSLKGDLKKLSKDEESKDFSILITGEEENENQDEENLEKIRIHKFMLQARSNLFREMFSLIKQEIDQIKDYSGKSIESINILIKYFYTNSIKLTADDNPELIIEELKDAQEYYQLHKHSNLNNLLSKIIIKKK
ncbi:regulator of chromosome condensation [Anaeramoeba flamelloides]|uniref:Regulator of chromosome condensation n=1 Tax=Anaeramoeba flamelloides TaxID=1746091 RepID=A0ABQ8YXQ3_9EUKA|nr:regulator of chromosome condensation [Anaeramoeba flamelloides]